MTAPALAVSTLVAHDRLRPVPAGALSSPHLIRIAGQLAVLGAALTVGSATSMASAVLVAQLAVGLGTYLVHRVVAPAAKAVARTVRAWGAGALAGAVAAMVVGAGVESQLWALAVSLGLLALGRALVAFRVAGSRIDAVLATLPPVATPAPATLPISVDRSVDTIA